MARSIAGRIGLTEVARAAGVSVATVSNTLNRPDIVTAATRAKVEAALAELDFVPNTAAASLRRGHNRLVGLVVPDIANPFYAEIARGVTEAADAYRYGVILCNSQDDATRELSQLEMLAEHRAAGALVVPVSADKRRLNRLRSLGTELVLIDRESPDGCSASIDDVLGGFLAAEHLIRTRGPRIALVNGPQSIPQCRDRREGARSALQAAGLDPDSLIEYEVPEMTFQSGLNLAPVLDDHGLPGGIFCTNDLLAIGLMNGLKKRGRDVPDDVALIGYGDLTHSSDLLVPLTTVDQPKFALGKAAFDLLFAEVKDEGGDHRHSTMVFKPSLVVRESAPA